jgi:predicted 2-oxoglutarate/Fe(II)-dependent dioxygenase YbiX
VEWVVNKKVRDTQHMSLSSAVTRKLNGIADANVLAFMNPYYNVAVRDREPLQVLHYGVGGHYIPHVDAETLYKDDSGLDMWEKTLDRDLSVVYFLNDDFAGGELFFPLLDLAIAPQAGTLVCFPSDHNYVHGVRPVTSGHRYTVVTWVRIEGMPSVDEINQSAMDEYHRSWPKQIQQPPRVGKGGVV